MARVCPICCDENMITMIAVKVSERPHVWSFISSLPYRNAMAQTPNNNNEKCGNHQSMQYRMRENW